MSKILLVDDDRELCLVVSEKLKADGHTLEMVHTGEEASENLRVGSYDLVVLDWSLSGGDVLRRHRALGGLTPIILLTDSANVHQKEEGIDLGADDYLTKPFAVKELAARVKTLLRRPPLIGPDTIKIGDLELDLAAQKVRKHGDELELQVRDFALLELLMRNAGVVFSPEAILQKVWADDPSASVDGLRAAIKRIRQKIDAWDDDSDSLIETIPRMGYSMRKILK